MEEISQSPLPVVSSPLDSYSIASSDSVHERENASWRH